MKKSFNYQIAPITPADEPFLWEMLYQAIYLPASASPLPKAVVCSDELARYVRHWGRVHDFGLIARTDEHAIGAVWLRLLKGEQRGYGYVDGQTPELSMALLPEYRSQGVGTELLKTILQEVQKQYNAVSLSVNDDNPAQRLYERHGFEIVNRENGSIVMKKVFDQGDRYVQ